MSGSMPTRGCGARSKAGTRAYLDWWKDRGPDGFQAADVYLRTAVGVEPGGLGQVRLCPHARLPLGHPPGAAGRGPHDRLRRAQGRAGLAGGAGRIPRDAAPAHHRAGRHRARLGRAAAPARRHRALALRSAQPVPGQCRGGAPSLGDGLPVAEIFRPRRARGGRGLAAPPLGRPRQPAPPRRVQRARPPTGSPFSCSPSSPTATARCSCMRWRNRASTRCRAPAASC